MLVNAIFFLASSSAFLWASAFSFLCRSACRIHFQTSQNNHQTHLRLKLRVTWNSKKSSVTAFSKVRSSYLGDLGYAKQVSTVGRIKGMALLWCFNRSRSCVPPAWPAALYPSQHEPSAARLAQNGVSPGNQKTMLQRFLPSAELMLQ